LFDSEATGVEHENCRIYSAIAFHVSTDLPLSYRNMFVMFILLRTDNAEV